MSFAIPTNIQPRTRNLDKNVAKASVNVPSKLANSLEACNQKLFPNTYTCLHLLLIIPVSTAATEHSQSCLQVVKTKLQSTMGQNRLNALMLLYIHKDISLNYNRIIDLYAKQISKKNELLKSIDRSRIKWSS